MEHIKLKSGFKVPVLGLGTWRLAGSQCTDIVRKALDIGYSHIDTADYYRNHEAVGKAMKGHDRSKIFLTTKVWRTELSREGITNACRRALRELGTDYIDLYLIHWPSETVPIEESMEAMDGLVREGLVRSVGVSNFDEGRLSEAMASSGVPMSVNQVEFSPHLYQKRILDFCKRKGVAVTGYCPLGRGEVLADPAIRDIAKRISRTPAQVALRWLIQHGVIAIPKSSSEGHLRENMDVFGWSIPKEDMARIDGIGVHKRIINPIASETTSLSKIPDSLLGLIPRGIKRKVAKDRFFRE